MSTLQERINEAFNRLPIEKQVKARLAKHCGISAPSVASWFNGETKTLRYESAVLAAEYLGVDPSWLMHRISGNGPPVSQAGKRASDNASLPEILSAKGLTSLQSATVEALVDALRAGCYSDEQCAKLLAEYLRMSCAAASKNGRRWQ